MRFAVETWAPEYGVATGEEALDDGGAQVDPWVECGPDEWAPLPAPSGTARIEAVLFIDGVRRVEANAWITDDDGEVRQGIFASYAAGAVRCDGAAVLCRAEVRRGLFCPVEGAEPVRTRHADFALHVSTGDAPEQLSLDLQARMGDLEAQVEALERGAALTTGNGTVRGVGTELVLVDGPLKFSQNHPGTVGYVKTHHRAYGPPVVRETVTLLRAGERTPLLLVGDGRFPRFSWYLRLPGELAHGWSGIVRLEASAELPVGEAAALADRLSVTLPAFASVAQKDPRAPQNLYPIGGLERELRRRLGDPALIERSLRVAAAATRGTRPPAGAAPPGRPA